MGLPIEIHGLSKIYRGKKKLRVEALRNLNLAVDSGEVFGFLGPNGAGKSTTIKIMMGLISQTEGEAKIFGIQVTQAAARVRVGYLPENPSLYDFLTAREYLAFVGKTYGMSTKDINSRSNEALTRLELNEAADRQIRSYSKGMVQRLGLAQALLHDPDLYILDEPMSGLDPIGRVLVKDIIRELKERGKTVFFSTHITADVEAVCDRLGVIVKGRLEALDKVENVLRRGIEGYTVQVSGNAANVSGDFVSRKISDTLSEYDVPKDSFNLFIDMVSQHDGKVELIETKRRNLEEFFLEIVKHELRTNP